MASRARFGPNGAADQADSRPARPDGGAAGSAAGTDPPTGGVLLPRLCRRPCPSPPDPSSPLDGTARYGHLTPVSFFWYQAVQAGGGPSCCRGASASVLPSTPPATGARLEGDRRPSSIVTGTSGLPRVVENITPAGPAAPRPCALLPGGRSAPPGRRPFFSRGPPLPRLVWPRLSDPSVVSLLVVPAHRHRATVSRGGVARARAQGGGGGSLEGG